MPKVTSTAAQSRVDRLRGTLRARETLLTAIRSSPIYKDYVATLEDVLAEERDRYESMAADEYTRGRISMLKDLISEIK